MIGIEEAYCNTMIRALLLANYALLEAPVVDALQSPAGWGKKDGKRDTLGLDAIPEIAILECLKNFDQHALLLTEEAGVDSNVFDIADRLFRRDSPTLFICDPTDRSEPLKEYLRKNYDESQSGLKISDVLKRPDTRKRWAEDHGAPCSITGAYSAITCIRRGLPICTVLLNYITQELIVACSAGVYRTDVPQHNDVERWQMYDFSHVQIKGTPIRFRPTTPSTGRRFVTFIGKSVYRQNLLDSRLVRENDLTKDLHYDTPGGPSRVLYLSDLQPEEQPISFVIANGEKIGEWIHWLGFCRFSISPHDPRRSALSIYEITEDRPWTKEGVLMSPSAPYSIFRPVESNLDKTIIDVQRFENFPNPSRYRGMLLVAAAGNPWIVSLVKRYGHRAILFPDM